MPHTILSFPFSKKKVKHVVRIHDLHIWSLGPRLIATTHVLCEEVRLHILSSLVVAVCVGLCWLEDPWGLKVKKKKKKHFLNISLHNLFNLCRTLTS